MDRGREDLGGGGDDSFYFGKYGEFPPEEYATEIQCAEQNADSLLRGGDRVNLRAPVVLRARRDTGCQGYFQPVQDY